MSPRTNCLSRRSLCCAMFLLAGAFAAPPVHADPIYAITDLGTLNGQTSSVATSINNQGQVVGISYNSSDGYFASGLRGAASPPRFDSTGGGAQSFLYGNGQITAINPTGGLAMSISDSGQVVGGPNASVNGLGQYVSGAYSGIDSGNPNTLVQLVSGNNATQLPALFDPYAINNAGQIAGAVALPAGGDSHPAIYQNGQLTDLFSKVASGQFYDSRAIAINQQGDMLITVAPMNGTVQSYLYLASTGRVTDLTSLPSGSGMIAAALNNKDQAVGNGFLYNNGTIQALASLISSGSGWSNLNATGINDAGQIVGQGLIDGQECAFEMSPTALEAPEPATMLTWGLVISLAAAARFRAARASRAH